LLIETNEITYSKCPTVEILPLKEDRKESVGLEEGGKSSM
jgi:hypothetical protein